ncbi:hypothetical protein AB8A31_09975 [Tardiphaga sp. 804_B3_N1_9]|uniref:hypothetical protein n=1 Tax=Tardiphaga TaxID=1395974 RepID=UPI001586ED8B|nr:hypothetical protein [Tardiphaga robiniae]
MSSAGMLRVGATAFGLFIGLTQLWKAFGEFFTVKVKYHGTKRPDVIGGNAIGPDRILM